MADLTTCELISGCRLREMGDKFLLMVYPEDARPFALDVNASFAFLVKVAQRLGGFTAGDLAEALMEEYGLPEETAASEAEATIGIWRKYGIARNLF